MAKFYTFEVPQESRETNFNKMVADSNSMETPPALFAAISEHFGGLDIDVAARGGNGKTNNTCRDGLTERWEVCYSDIGLSMGRVWCNPPYSNPYPWVAKAYDEVKGLC